MGLSDGVSSLLAAIGQGGNGGRRDWVCASCRGPAADGEKLCDACRRADRAVRNAAHLTAAWASLPDRFRDAHSWAWDPKRAEILRRASAAGTGILLTGAPGAGKTALACALFGMHLRDIVARDPGREVVEAAGAARFVTDAQLSRAVASHPLGRGDAPLYVEAVRASVLVLDELGYDLASLRRPARDVLFARYDAGKPTIITTGHRQIDVEAHWGGGAGRRMWTQSAVVDLDQVNAPPMRIAR